MDFIQLSSALSVPGTDGGTATAVVGGGGDGDRVGCCGGEVRAVLGMTGC
jgi:hypothetical protein